MKTRGQTTSGAFMLTAGCWITTVAFKQVLHVRLVMCSCGRDGLEGYKAKGDCLCGYFGNAESIFHTKEVVLRKAERSILQPFPR